MHIFDSSKISYCLLLGVLWPIWNHKTAFGNLKNALYGNLTPSLCLKRCDYISCRTGQRHYITTVIILK